jgi:diguanylate cyclase (GGDEF)-like protein
LWFVTTAGIVTVDPAHSEARTIRPSPRIEQVRFNRKSVPFEHGMTAGPGGGDVEIQFTAPDFVAPERVHFRYRLRGFDSEWTESGERRDAIYTKLPPGKYVFDLQAADGNSDWNSTVASLNVVLVPHFWQTGWFRGICGLLLVMAAVTFYRLRVRYLIERAHALEVRVSQRTAELQAATRVAEEAHCAMRVQAMRDSLTDLWNRRAILEMLDKEIARAERDDLPVSLLMVDLDHFKTINDTYGHLIGDEALEEVARRIPKAIRAYDSAGRYGGEEFLIILPGCSKSDGVHRAEDLRRAIADTPVQTARGLLTTTCSLGVASHRSGIGSEELIREADEAMYRAKRLGRNRVEADVHV